MNNPILSKFIGWNVMRLMLFQLLLAAIFSNVSLATDGNAQDVLNQKITLQIANKNISDVLSRIEKLTDVKFSYSPDLIQSNRKVSVSAENETLAQVLSSLLGPLQLKYEMVGNRLILTRNASAQKKLSSLVDAATVESVAPPITIHGRVFDESNKPLPGATILLKGTTSTGTVTDAEGVFTLNVPDGNGTLVVSSIGYTAKEVSINNQATIDISLVPDVKSLNEVVVVGYGTQKRSDLTGSVGSVKSTELLERPAINVEQSLQGRIAGVNVSVNSGRPGGNTNIRIRGYSSINATNNPLYVVDGIIWAAGIDALNPADIESIDVLKDASATAIYGTRGANGVILVTTKRGRKGGAVSYDTYVSASRIARKRDVLNAKEFLALEDLAYQNVAKYDPAGWASGKYADKDPKIKRTALIGKLFDANLNPLYDVDWQDETTRTAVSQNHNLGFTGGSDQTTYGLFLNYNDNQGIIKNTYLKRYSGRLVIDNQVKKWLKVGATLNYSYSEERRADEGVGGNNIPRMLIEMVPIVPIRYPDGTYGKRQDYPDMESGDNPVALANEDNRMYKKQVFGANTYANITLMPGLDFRTTFGANIASQYNPFSETNQVQLTRPFRGYAEIWSYDTKFLQWQNYLTYNKQIDASNSINVVAGAELQKYTYLQWFSGVESLPDNYYQYYNLGVSANPLPPTSSYNAYQMASYFARGNYNYKDKILVTATGRYDGSSRFGANNKYAFFPSAAVAWRLSQEDFLKNSHLISDLKVRASYGLTGNSEINSYQSLATLSTNTSVFGGQRASGTIIGTLANPNLRWEKTAQYDLGASVSFLKGRINLEADLYLKKTHDLLLSAPVPLSSGYASIYKNIGSMENRGLELSLNTINIDNKDFTWSTNFNISFLKNKVTALGDANDDIFPDPQFLNNTNILRVGESVGSFYGLVRTGTWGSAEADQAAKYGKKPGDLKFLDLNNDGQINDQDRIITGKGIPTGYGTFSNTLRYKGLDLTVDLQFSYGNDILNLTHHSALDRTGQANSYAEVLNGWTPTNQNTFIAEARPSYVYYDTKIDSYKVEDGSFLRGRNLVLGYTFPSDFVQRIKLSRLRVYASAQNFFVLTKYTGYDPEVSTYGNAFAQGIQFFDYPKAHVFTAGLNVSF
jgi:TonB-linked SusC/RagA family outer membrane protein